MGTPFSEVFLDFETNMTGVKLTGRETMVFQAFKRSVARCEKITQTNLSYLLNNKIFYFKLYELSNIDDNIVFTINENEYEILTFITDTKDIILDTILNEIINDYPLSRLSNDGLIIRSSESIDVKLIDVGNHTIILQGEYDGIFNNDIPQSDITLIGIGMTKEWFDMQHSKVALERNNMGTKHFDKDPDRKKQYDGMIERSSYWNDEFFKYRQEFYTFGY